MDKAEIENYLEAGKIHKAIVEVVRSFVKKDMLLIDIAKKIEEEIANRNAKPAFPVNLSLNEIAAHYTPSKDDSTKVEGLLKVDFGVDFNGAIADGAFSLDFSDDGKFGEMIKLNETALETALGKLEPNVEISIVGQTISKVVSDFNEENISSYSIIRNLSGHSLGEGVVHAGLTISNVKNNNPARLNNVGAAIEPFLTEGKGEIYESVESEIFILQNDRQVRDASARKVLKFIKENFETKPFCKRWVEDAGLEKVDFCLKVLTREGVLHNFPVLVEKNKKPVSQAEHTVLFLKDKVVVTTRD
jgi:methionyl aminopeptidase